MSPDKQRIAIAEACGMVWCRIGTDEEPYRMLCWWNPAYTQADLSEPICNPEYMWEHGSVQDYLNDLDAMHEAETWAEIARCHFQEYEHQLRCIRGTQWGIATAAERAEAFLRTLGKWEDDK